ncbi:hypothetical protein ACFL96_10950 [Thermoproteota archaeon]
MRKIGIVLVILVLLLSQAIAVCALNPSEAREAWKDTKQHSREMQEQHREAKLGYAGNKSVENEQEVIETGKASLHAALEEAEAWLVWKKVDAEDNDEIPDDLRDTLIDDVETNLDKIEDLKAEVDGVNTRFELGVVFLKMIGKYFELLADVARNSGRVWVHIGNTRADTLEGYVETLRDETDDDYVLEKLDMADDEIAIARRNIDNAEDTYAQVKVPGTPLMKFAEGNSYLRAAKANLMGAHRHLADAYRLMVR